MTRPSQPESIPLLLGGKTLATAYPHRPPGQRHAVWSWRMVFSRDGERHQHSLGRLDEKDVPAALLEAWSNIDPASLVQDQTGIETVADLCRVWYATLEKRPEESGLAANTLKSYKRNCIYVRDTIGDRKLKSLKAQDVQDMVDMLGDPAYRARKEKETPREKGGSGRGNGPNRRGQLGGPRASGLGYGHRTINVCLTVLASCWAWGRKQGYPVPDISPTSFSIKGKKADSRFRYRDYTPTSAEVAALYDDLRRTPLRLAVWIGWKAGCRVHEIAPLRWSDLQREPDGWYLRVDSAKTGLRRVALSDSDAAELLSYRSRKAEDSDLMFPARYAGTSFTARLTRALEVRKTRQEEQFTFHGIRRRWCMNLIDAGVPIPVYVDQSGHSAEVAIRHYARISDRDRRAGVIRLEERGGGNDIYAYLAENGLTVADAIEMLREHRRVCGVRPLRVIGGGSSGVPDPTEQERNRPLASKRSR